jgi:AcrR family transcriptional regulator
MAEITRDRIVKQAIDCLAKNPHASLEEIAIAAGVGRATIYRYFKSRNDLNVTLKTTAGEKLQSAVVPILEKKIPAREKFIQMVEKLIPLGASLNVSSYFNLPFKEENPRVRELYRKHMDQTGGLCRQLKNEGVVDPDLPLAWLVTCLDRLVFGAWETVQNGDIAPNAAPGLVIRTFFTGMGTVGTREWMIQNKGEME